MCPSNINPDDKFAVCHVNSETGEETIIESQPTRGKGQHAADILNEHERVNNRPQNYYYREAKPGELDKSIKQNSQFGR